MYICIICISAREQQEKFCFRRFKALNEHSFPQLLLLRSIFYESAGKESNGKFIQKSGLKMSQIGYILHKKIYIHISLHKFLFQQRDFFFYHGEQIIALKSCFPGNLRKLITRELKARGLKS